MNNTIDYNKLLVKLCNFTNNKSRYTIENIFSDFFTVANKIFNKIISDVDYMLEPDTAVKIMHDRFNGKTNTHKYLKYKLKTQLNKTFSSNKYVTVDIKQILYNVLLDFFMMLKIHL